MARAPLKIPIFLAPALILLSAISLQPAFAAQEPTELALIITPNPVTDPAGASITATLTHVGGTFVQGDNVNIRKAVDSTNNQVACELATSYSSIYTAKSNNEGKITYNLANTANLGGNTIGFKAYHPSSHGNAASESACVNLVILTQLPNQLPVANAGNDITINENTLVTLDGSDSSDPDGLVMSYAWAQVAGPTVTLSSTTAQKPAFMAPLVSSDVTMSFRLIVTDNFGATSAPDSVDVLVRDTNIAPSANAGADLTVNEGTAGVMLDDSSSSDPDGIVVSYAWTQTSGPQVTLFSATGHQPTFTAPLVPLDTMLTFSLVVTDSDGAESTSDEVIVLVKDVPAMNDPPVAFAGNYQHVDENSPVTLDGSLSYDSDGTISSYLWTQTAGPLVILTGATTAAPSLTAPSVSADTMLNFSLVVTDDDAAISEADTVNILVKDIPVANNQPSVNAGADISADEGTPVNLSGTASDPDAGDTLAIAWTQIGTGPSVTLTGSDTLTPSFTAPQVDADAQVTLRLNATDNRGSYATDDIVVTIRNVAPLPTGESRNVNSEITTDSVGNHLVTSSAELKSSSGLDSAWIETFDPSSGQWIKRIENIQNSGFNGITCGQRPYTQAGGFADKNGCTALPWGFEVWGCKTVNGKVICNDGNKAALDIVYDNSVSFEGTHSAKMVGLYDNSTVVMAIPSYATFPNEVGKPDIVAGETYRMEVMVKLENVKGTGCKTVDNPPVDPGFCGFRIYQTFFDSSLTSPKYVYFGQKYAGTADWFKVTFDAKAEAPNGPDSTLLKGDPAIELAGKGTVWVDSVKFYSLDSASPRDLKIKDATTLSVTSTPNTATYFRPGYNNNNPVNINTQLMNNDGNTVYMGPNSQITISKWTTYSEGSNIAGVTANIAVFRSYGGVATVTATVGGVPYPLNCQFDTNGINKLTIIPCDLMAAGIDTPEEINNLVLKVIMNSAANGSIDSIKIVVDRTPIAPANTWVPARMTWFTVHPIPDWRIGFSDMNGQVFHT